MGIFGKLYKNLFFNILLLSTVLVHTVCQSYARPKNIEERIFKRFPCKAALKGYNKCPDLSNCFKKSSNAYNCKEYNAFHIKGLPENISTVILKPHETADPFYGVDPSIISLHIILHKVWNGRYLINEKNILNLRGAEKLTDLRQLVISQCHKSYYQPYTLHFSKTTFSSLIKLKVLKINIDLENQGLADIMKPLVSLEVLDLSMTKGMNTLVLKQLLQHIPHRNLQHVCLIRFQTMAMVNYSNIFSVMELFSGRTFPKLETFDISSNAIGVLKTGIATVMPSLNAYSFSQNMLMNYYSCAAFFEILISRNLSFVDASFQENIYQDVFTDDNSHYQDFFKKMIFCANKCSGYNISHAINNASSLYCLLVCIMPSTFLDVPEFLIPSPSEVYAVGCPFYFQPPIYGKEWYLDSLRWISITGNVPLGQSICAKNSSLTVFSIGNNKGLYNFFFFYTSTYGKYLFTDIEILNLDNNDMTVELNNYDSFITWNKKVKFLYAAGNNFTMNNNLEMCKSMSHLELVDLSQNLASNITLPRKIFRNCSKLRRANFARGNINDLNLLDLHGTLHLDMLNLSHNQLKDVHINFFESLERFSISRNRSVGLDLTGNPFRCDCSSNIIDVFKNYHSRNHIQMKNMKNYYCYGPSKLYNIYELMTNEKYLSNMRSGCPNIGLFIGVGITTGAIGSSFIICLTILIFRKRWHIKYYTFKLKQFFKLGSAGDIEHKRKYDAFVSYCTEDRFWVHDVLMKTLEEQYNFKLCIHYRDFPVGEPIDQTIVDFMEQSRQTILVVTNNFFQSQWCPFEMNQALLFAERRKSNVIIIKLDEISEENLSETRILDTHTYLEWSDHEKAKQLFWAKLVGFLYGDADGSGMCCCPYGTKAIKFDQIFDSNDVES